LTCAPYENKDDSKPEELWDYCLANYKKGFLLTCYSNSGISIEEENSLGI